MMRTILTIALPVLAVCLVAAAAVHAEPADAQADTATVWYDDWNAGLAAAKEQHRPVLVDFFTDACGGCKWMHENVFTDPAIVERLKTSWVGIRVNTGRVDVTADWKGTTYKYYEIAKHFRVIGVPTFLFFDSDGEPVQTVVGGKKVEMFGDILDFFAERAYERDIPFETFRKNRTTR